MKRINLTLIVIFLTSFAYAQNDYYWSAGKKHYLKQQTNAFVVKLQKEFDFENSQKIKSERNLKELTRMKSDLGIAISNDILDNAKKLKEYKEFSNAMPVYHLGDLPLFLTGEILMQPKNNASVEDILKLANNKVSIKNRTKYNTYILETEDWDKLLEYSNLIYESGLVEYCHPNFIAPREKHQINDPKYSEQYYLNNTGQLGGTSGIDINAPEAWGITTGSCPITVAVIDDGVEDHEDLNGRVLQGFTPQFSIQNPDTQGGPNQNDPTGSHVGHGQCCAGIIGATHNSLGIRGIAPEVNIVPINIFNDWFTYLGVVHYAEDIQDIVDAIDFAWDDAEADIISNSWSFIDPTANFDPVTQAIGRARTQGRTQGINHLGCVVVFASGNDASPYNHLTVRFPASVDGVITVGAIDKNGNIHNYSCRGISMDLVAPSGALDLNGDVRTIDREGSDGYETGNYTDRFGGTSAACPQVSGVAALMLSIRPDLTETQVRTTLQQTATDMGSSGFDNTYGFGRLNAFAAIQAIYPALSGPTTVCSSGATFTINNFPAGATISWAVSENLQIINRQDTIQVTVNRISGGNATITSTITSCGNIITLTRTFNSFVSLSKEYDYLNCNDIIVTATASSGASIIWETTNGLLINGMSSPQSGIGNTVTISSPYGTGGEVTARNCYEYSTIDFSTCVEWSANLRFINSSSPGNPMQGEPLQAEADPAPWDGSNYRWYIDGQFIAHTYEPILYTYDWLCGDHQLQVQAVTPDGLTDLWQNGIGYWGLCGYYMSLSPNPASDYVEVSITAESSATNQANRDNRLNNIFTVRVFNAYGVQVYSSQKAGNKFNIPISNLKEGVYVVEVSEGKMITRKQLIVKKN